MIPYALKSMVLKYMEQKSIEKQGKINKSMWQRVVTVSIRYQVKYKIW